MHSEEFIIWFIRELRNLKRYVGKPDMFEKCRHLVNESENRLGELFPEDQTQVYAILANYSSNSYMLGDYQIPYDEREEHDFIEEILGTLVRVSQTLKEPFTLSFLFR